MPTRVNGVCDKNIDRLRQTEYQYISSFKPGLALANESTSISCCKPFFLNKPSA